MFLAFISACHLICFGQAFIDEDRVCRVWHRTSSIFGWFWIQIIWPSNGHHRKIKPPLRLSQKVLCSTKHATYSLASTHFEPCRVVSNLKCSLAFCFIWMHLTLFGLWSDFPRCEVKAVNSYFVVFLCCICSIQMILDRAQENET